MKNNGVNHQTKEDLAHLQQAVDHLMDRFESVQVFATRRNEGDSQTVTCNLGGGNYNARYGMVDRWLKREEQYERLEAAADFDGGEVA